MRVLMRGFGSTYRQKDSRYWWIQYWRDGKRVRESSGSDKLKAAQDLLKQRVLETRGGDTALPVAGGPVVAQLFEELERDYIINKLRSLPDLKIRWARHIQPFFGEMVASKVGPTQIRIYIVERQKAGAANATINRELAALRRMFNLAAEMGALQFVPKIKALDERENVREGTMEQDVYEIFAVETAKIGIWFRAMFEAGYSLGWRKSELTELKVERVDLMERIIRLTPKMTKSKSYREVKMPPKLFELVKLCVAGKGPDDYVFTREKDARGRKAKNGGHITDFRKDWAKVCKAAGVAPGCHGGLIFHDLRRTSVSNMIQDGIDEKTAMTISGHKTRSVFDRYHIIRKEALQEAAAKMDRGARERHNVEQQRELFEQQAKFDDSAIDGETAIAPPKKPSQNDGHSTAIAAPLSKPN
jgi:integrase